MEEFVLYAYNVSDNSPQQTDWRLHQYHIRDSVKDEAKLVVSKIFHQSQNNLCELAEKLPSESELPCKDIFNHAETDDLDHMSLKERHRILLANKSPCPDTTSAEKSATAPKRNHVGAIYREDIGPMLQEISSAPPIVESMDDDNGRRLHGEHLSDAQMSSTECFVGNNPNERPCSSSTSELPTTEPTCGSEHNQLVVTNHGTFLVDVKLEPALIILVAWEIWKHRNDCVFNGAQPNVAAVLQKVAAESSLWCFAGAKFLREMLLQPLQQAVS